MSAKEYAIVGIDPGATFAISILGLSGGIRRIESFKNEGMPEAARRIEEHCTPSLLACDTNPAPEAALRLASYFSCRLYVPRQSMREDEKRAIVALERQRADARDGRHEAIAENAHERDAYAASLLAYRAHANKLRQIDALEGLAEQDKGRIKHLLLRGYRVQDAFLLLREPEESKVEERKAFAPQKTASLEELRSRLESLARENSNLKLHISRLEEEKSALLHQLRLYENGVRQTLMREGEYRRLRHQLEESLRRLTFRRKKKKHAIEPQKPPEKHPEQHSHKAGKEGINNLAEPKLDLERMVEEYRKRKG